MKSKTPKSAPKQRRSGTRIAAASLGAGLAAATCYYGTEAATALAQPVAVEDRAYHKDGNRSPIEEAMTNALQQTMGTPAAVRCANPSDTDNAKEATLGGLTLRVSSGEHIWYGLNPTEYVRMDPLACDQLENIPFLQPNADDEVKLPVAYALTALTFQGVVAGHSPENDSIAECYTVQEAAAVARYLGATAQVSRELGETIVENHALFASDGATAPTDCVDENLRYDLNPNSPGFFPYGDPISRPVN